MRLPRLDSAALKVFAVRHRVILGLVTVGFVLRVITILGFRWAIWFPDSYPYVDVALHPRPDPVRTFGYPLFLLILKPLHSVAVVITAQHLMGLAVAVILYALLRRPHMFKGERGLPGWAAALVVAPVLFDGNQIELEHLLLSDVYFLLLVTAAFALVLWNRTPSVRAVVAASALLSLAAITRTIGLPLIIIMLVFLVIRRTGWKTVAGGLAAAVIPIAAYATWYSSVNGSFALSGTDGVFLYSRTMTFADCKYFADKLRNEQLPLCEDRAHPPGKRPVSHFYVWEQPQIFFYPGGGGQFAPYKSDLARDFAKKAIMAQPGDYAKTVIGDFARTFRWDRPVYPDPKTYSYYVFPKTNQPYWPDRGPMVAKYDAQKTATRVVEPYAGFMRGYQKVVRLPGTILGFLLLIGLAGVLVRWRRFGGVALFPFGIAMALLVIPPATVLFDYRYVLPAVPFAAIAAAIAFRDFLTWLQGRRRPQPTLETPAEEPVLAAAS